jgi:predicted small secreted protein
LKEPTEEPKGRFAVFLPHRFNGERHMSNRIAAVAVVLAATLAMSACANTVRGVGRDVGNTVDATGAAANDIAR